MSTLREVHDLIDRMRRLTRRTEIGPGSGDVWTAKVPGYGVQTYRVSGIKSSAEIEDDVSSLSIWVWSAKDYLKKLIEASGGDPDMVERYVDSTPDLQVCADIANSAKHAGLTRSRTGRFLKADKPRFKIPQGALGTITFLANEVRVDVLKPELVTFQYMLLDGAGNEVGDAMTHLKAGVAAWEKFLEQLP